MTAHDWKLPSFSLRSFREWWRGVEKVGLLLAIVAVVVGMWHLKEINGTLEKVDNVHHALASQIEKTDATLTSVRETLSTRYLSNFPDFMPYIVDLVANANSSVTIFCDIPGYGVFSDPENAGKYCDLLEQKRHNPKFRIELTCMDERNRHEYIAEQFGKFDFNSPTLRGRLQRFAASRGLDVSGLSTHASLITAIEEADADTLRHTFLSRALQTHDRMPIYFWIADDKTAIFSIPALSADAIEYGFTTSDKELITAFKNMKRRYDDAARRNTSGRAVTLSSGGRPRSK